MSESKTIKGHAWIEGDSLVQEQTLIVPGSLTGSTTGNVVLIADIWDDLMSSSGTYKFNSKKDYFFWEVEQTSIDDDSTTVIVRYDCPRPKEGLFEEPYDPESVSGEWAKYWVTKFKTASENYEYKAAIQKKEIVFPGTSYYDFSQDQMVTTEETRVKNTDLGDIENLLSLF